MTCRYLVARYHTDAATCTTTWMYGYLCGQPSIDQDSTACTQHLPPRLPLI